MDDKKLVSLKLTEHKPEPRPEVVSALQDLLEMAKDGKLQSIITIYLHGNDLGSALVGIADQQTVINYIGMLHVTATDLSNQILKEAFQNG